MLSTWSVTVGVDLDHLVEVMFIKFSTVRYLHPLSFHILWKEMTMLSPLLRGRGSAPPPWGWTIYIIYLKFFCMGDLFLLHSFISSIPYLYKCNSSLFYIWDFNPILRYLFCCLNFFTFGHWELFQADPFVPLLSPIIVFFEHLLSFWNHDMFQAHLIYSLPYSWNQSLP